ncbi:WYL domain-containing protein [Arcobacter sp. CECT 8986]|uniref:WYL domain-containing protein n=1 Tax=Arcobacter sp. CECT 8986 TaxID=2044507 RepID=UPI001009A5C0|nr:WYL domain-containing protein [Arcobacter sp. CECT 8986]RXK01211.1 WYL domain-containing protein [Arcobacter sp. CECT 8986]
MSRKILEVLDLLKELAMGHEIIINDYAIQNDISPRTVRRYFEEIKEFFGEHSIEKTVKGGYTSINKDSLNSVLLPNLEEKIEMEKLVDLLHIINPGFSEILPPEYKKIDAKIKKELAQVFLIKGTPTENQIDYKIFELLITAIKNHRYCQIIYENEVLKDIKPLKMIYSKGNWSLATLSKNHLENNGFRILRLGFISKIKLDIKTFNKEVEADIFITKSQTPVLDAYKVEPFEVVVAIDPSIKKYFLQKKFLRSQKILEELNNGWLKVSYKITHKDVIIMLCRRWFPKMVIMTPSEIREDMEEYFDIYTKNKNEILKVEEEIKIL